jgi:vacuolar-type H+-ATPase subunit H
LIKGVITMQESMQASDRQGVNSDAAKQPLHERITSRQSGTDLPSASVETGYRNYDASRVSSTTQPSVNSADIHVDTDVSRNNDVNRGSSTQPNARSTNQGMNPMLSRALIGGLVAGTLGSLIGAFAGKRVGQGFNTAVKGIGEASKTIGEGLSHTGKGIGQAVQSIAEGATEAIVGGAVDTAKGVAEGATQALVGTVDTVQNTARGVSEVTKQTVEGTVDAIQSTAQGVNQVVQSAAEMANDTVNRASEEIKQTATSASDTVKSTAQDLNQSVQSSVDSVSQNQGDRDRTIADRQPSKNNEVETDRTPTIYISAPDPVEGLSGAPTLSSADPATFQESGMLIDTGEKA